jgi:hypothetical protein
VKTSRHVGTRERRDRLRLTFAYRSFSRTLVLPRATFVIPFLLVPFAGALYLGATCYFVFHDDLLASLTRHQVEMQYAYEDRIAALHRELENVTQQAHSDPTDFADRIHALSERQDKVESRTALVAALAERIKLMRAPVADSESEISSIAPTPKLPADSESNPSESPPAPPPSSSASNAPRQTADPPLDGKPHPEGFDLRLREGSGNASDGGPASPPQSAKSALMSPIDFESARRSRHSTMISSIVTITLIAKISQSSPIWNSRQTKYRDGSARRSLQPGLLRIVLPRRDPVPAEVRRISAVRSAALSSLCPSCPTARLSPTPRATSKRRSRRLTNFSAYCRMYPSRRRCPGIRK